MAGGTLELAHRGDPRARRTLRGEDGRRLPRRHDLSAQTHQAMVHIGTILRELGADYGDVCKMIAIYAGSCGAEALHANLPIRSSYFADPGPATTGIPVPVLAYDAMVVEIDAFAMKRGATR